MKFELGKKTLRVSLGLGTSSFFTGRGKDFWDQNSIWPNLGSLREQLSSPSTIQHISLVVALTTAEDGKECTFQALLHRLLESRLQGQAHFFLSMLMNADLANSINHTDSSQHRSHCKGLI